MLPPISLAIVLPFARSGVRMPLEICKHYESKDLAENMSEGDSRGFMPLKVKT
jgi:hypothetical protein